MWITVRSIGNQALAARVQALASELRRSRLRFVLTAEQKGSNRESMGSSPHLHAVVYDQMSQHQVRELVRRAFPLSDVYAEAVSAERAEDLVERFLLRMEKKGRTPAEKRTTQQWRSAHKLRSFYS